MLGNPFFFLHLFTASDGTLPPFFVFISFLGPLLGISMGFDAINSEHDTRYFKQGDWPSLFTAITFLMQNF